MKKIMSGIALAVGAAIVVSACTTRETRIIQPVAVAPAGTTVVVPEREPDIIVDVD